jgi:hypothetical protein
MTYREMDVQFHSFSILALDGRKWSASHPSCFTPYAHGRGEWVGSQSQSGCFVKKRSPYNPLHQLLPKHACDFYVGYYCQNTSGQGKMYENCYMYSKPSSFAGTK